VIRQFFSQLDDYLGDDTLWDDPAWNITRVSIFHALNIGNFVFVIFGALGLANLSGTKLSYYSNFKQIEVFVRIILIIWLYVGVCMYLDSDYCDVIVVAWWGPFYIVQGICIFAIYFVLNLFAAYIAWSSFLRVEANQIQLFRTGNWPNEQGLEFSSIEGTDSRELIVYGIPASD
jgi:hypothetical protein